MILSSLLLYIAESFLFGLFWANKKGSINRLPVGSLVFASMLIQQVDYENPSKRVYDWRSSIVFDERLKVFQYTL